MRLRLLLPLLSLLLAGTATAQSVRWQLPDNGLERGKISQLALVFDGCEPAGEVPLPAVPDLEFGNPSENSYNSISTDTTGRRVQITLKYLSYPVRPATLGTITIPSFTVSTDQGQFTVPAATMTSREATLGDSGIPVTDITSSTLRVGDGEIWAGEVIPVEYELGIAGRVQANLASEPTWDPAPLVVEAWGEPTVSKDASGPRARNVITYSARGYFPQAGTHTLRSVQQAVNIGVSTGGFFTSLRAEQFAITSDAPQVTVKPLPAGAPASFAGAVGSFTLTSRVVPEEASVSEPVTWTLTLEGTGNWPAISALPAREASNAFRVVQPQANRSTAEGKLFDGSIAEDVVLIPTAAGTYTLPPVEWTYFDPQAGVYRTVRTEPHELVVAPATPPAGRGASPAPATPPAVDGPFPLDASAPIRSTPAPTSPSALPLEPLPGTAAAPTPVTTRTLVMTGIVAAAVLPLCWLLLAYRHARASDPGRFARAAKRQLPASIQSVAHANDDDARAAALLEWKRLIAILWQSPHATPTRSLFADDETMARLWRDAERALYARDATLPADWVERARTAADRKRAPRFPFLRCFALRHLFPVVVLGLTAAALYPSSAYAATAPQAVAAYNEGDFPAAEKTWRDAVAANPTDWIARHNLALALAQQGRTEEAGAHAAVAFIQNPRHPSTRWHLRYMLDRSGYTPPVFGRFLDPTWREKIAWLASPAQWQHALLAAFAGFALAFGLLLAAPYFPRNRTLRPFAWLFMVVATFAAAAAGSSLQRYGLTAEADVALTWRATSLHSIPTDLAEEQETTPLAAGSLARVTKNFLGWRQLTFPNGQTGWVRAEELVPLWQSAASASGK